MSILIQCLFIHAEAYLSKIFTADVTNTNSEPNFKQISYLVYIFLYTKLLTITAAPPCDNVTTYAPVTGKLRLR